MSSYGIMVESGEQNTLESNAITNSLPGTRGFLLEKNSSKNVVISTSVVGSLSEIKGNSNELRSMSSIGGLNLFGCQNRFYSCAMDKLYLTSQCGNDLTTSNSVIQYMGNPIG